MKSIDNTDFKTRQLSHSFYIYIGIKDVFFEWHLVTGTLITGHNFMDNRINCYP